MLGSLSEAVWSRLSACTPSHTCPRGSKKQRRCGLRRGCGELQLGILAQGAAVVIKWNWMFNPRKPNTSKRKLRIAWREPATFPYVPSYASAAAGSIFERASFSGEVLFEKAKVAIGGINGTYLVEATPVAGEGSKEYILARDSAPKAVLSVVSLNTPI